MARGHYATWSHEELALLLRAWAEQSARVPAPRNLSSAVFQQFQALTQQQTATSSRLETAVVFKMNAMRNMHAIICVFMGANAHSTSATVLQSCIVGGDGDGDGGSLDTWLAMPQHKRRRYFVRVNRKSYPYTEISREAFDVIHKILTKGGVRKFVLPEVYRDSSAQSPAEEAEPAASQGSKKVRREKKPTVESALSIRDAIAVIEEASEQFRVAMVRFKAKKTSGVNERTAEDEPVKAAAMADEETDSVFRSPSIENSQAVANDTTNCTAKAAPVTPPPPVRESSDLITQDDGSSTESEDEWDEIVPRSPAREEEGIAPTSTKEESKTFEYDYCDGAVADPGNETLKRSLSPAEPVYPEKRSRGVQPEVSLFMDALKQQTFALKDMLRKAKGGLKRDQLERKQILTHLRQEHDTRYEVVKRLQREEDETRRQRAEWRRERDELRREWVTLKGCME